MVPFEEFWERMKKEMMTWPKQNNDDRYRYSKIPRWSSAGRVEGKPLSCRYADGEDMVQYKTKNDRWASADRTDFETIYNDWDQYIQGLERSRLKHDLNRRNSYTIPTLKHFERLMR